MSAQPPLVRGTRVGLRLAKAEVGKPAGVERSGLVLVLAVAAIALVAGLIVGWVLGRRRARSRARAEAALVEAQRDAQLGEVKLGLARIEERYESSTRESDRLRTVEKNLRSDLLVAEQEKTRLDFELRQVGLVASRVPELESRLTQLEGLRVELSKAEDRVAELEPIAAELELRNQFIETLQRELTYRDERLVALEGKVDGLQRQLLGESPIRRLPPGRNDLPPPVVVPKEPIDLREPAQPASPPTTAHVSAAEEDPLPPVGRALEQALDGLGVRSFADLACVSDEGADANLHTASLDAGTASSTSTASVVPTNGAGPATASESITDTAVEPMGPVAFPKASAVAEFSAGR